MATCMSWLPAGLPQQETFLVIANRYWHDHDDEDDDGRESRTQKMKMMNEDVLECGSDDHEGVCNDSVTQAMPAEDD